MVPAKSRGWPLSVAPACSVKFDIWSFFNSKCYIISPLGREEAAIPTTKYYKLNLEFEEHVNMLKMQELLKERDTKTKFTQE